MFAYWFWHRQAVASAAAHQNVQVALVLNAYAEHFLHDHLAPGHIRTPRRNFHHAPSMAMHDLFNMMGADYRPRRTEQLTALLEYGVPAELLERLAIHEDSLPARFRAMEENGIVLFGDGELHISVDQELFMMFLSARSVLDVFESFATGRVVNSYSQYSWHSYVSDGDQVTAPQADMAYGTYEWSPPSDLQFIPVLGVFAGPQAFYSKDGHSTSRRVVGLQTLVLGWPGDEWAHFSNGRGSFIPQAGVTIGWDVVVDRRLSGHGPAGRLVFPIRDVDTQLSLLVGRRWYNDGDDLHATGWHVGGMIEMGLGLASVGIGVEHDARIVGSEKVSGVSAFSQLSVGWPLTSITRWLLDQ